METVVITPNVETAATETTSPEPLTASDQVQIIEAQAEAEVKIIEAEAEKRVEIIEAEKSLTPENPTVTLEMFNRLEMKVDEILANQEAENLSDELEDQATPTGEVEIIELPTPEPAQAMPKDQPKGIWARIREHLL